MKGTEKQIKWAEDIKANAIKTCDLNIEYQSGEQLFANNVIVYKIFRAALIAAFEKMDDAAEIIKKRARFDAATINQNVSRTCELIASGRLTIEKVAEMNGVKEY